MSAFGFSLPLLAARGARTAAAFAIAGVIPAVVADFVENRFVDPAGAVAFGNLFTFSRLSDATMTNAAGARVTVPAGSPRIGDHVAGINKGLRFESAPATQLLPYSQGSGTAAAPSGWWFEGAGSGEVAAVLSNGLGGYTFTGGDRSIAYQVSLSAGVHTVSVYVEPGATYAGIALQAFGFTGATGTLSASVADADSDGRVSITFTVDAGDGVGHFRFGQVGAGAGVVSVGGFQCEAGALPTSFIPSGASEVTRAGELLSVKAGKMPYAATGAFTIEETGEIDYADNGQAEEAQFWRWALNASDEILFRLRTSGGTGQLFARRAAGGSFGTSSTGSDYLSPGLGVPFSIAARFNAAALEGAEGGAALGENSAVPGMADFSGVPLQIGLTFKGTIARLRFFGDELGTAGIEGATA